MRLYSLTEMGPGWGWGSRIIEIVIQTLSLAMEPIWWVADGLQWLREKFFLN